MVKDLFIGIAFFAHHGGSDLAEAHTVAPAGPPEDDLPRDALLHLLVGDHEGLTVEMGGGEPLADFQFLAHDDAFLGAGNPQPGDAA